MRAHNPNQLPPCPAPDDSKTQDIGWSGRTWHWNDCWGRDVFQWREDLPGNVLEGEWRYGKLTGQGIDTTTGGDRYDGEFSSNQLHGQGTYRYANGDTYAGEFASGAFDGRLCRHQLPCGHGVPPS